MNAETKLTGTDLVAAVDNDPSLALVNADAFEAWLIGLRDRVGNLDHDLTRAKNRDAIRSAAAVAIVKAIVAGQIPHVSLEF